MASLTPRASGFWADQVEDSDDEFENMGGTSTAKDYRRSGHYHHQDDGEDDGYFGGVGDLEQQERLLGEGALHDGRTPVSTLVLCSWWKGGKQLEFPYSLTE